MKRLSTLLLLVVVVLSGCLAPLTPVPPGLPALPALETPMATAAAPNATPAGGTETTLAPTAAAIPTGAAATGPAPTGGPQATAGPSGTAPQEQPVVFPSGSDNVTFQGRLGAGGSDLYRLNGQVGQTMGVHLDAPGGQVSFGVMGANGAMLAEYTGAPDWSGVLTNTQVYLVDVHNFGAAPTPYSLRISLAPQPTPTATQAPPTPTQAPPTPTPMPPMPPTPTPPPTPTQAPPTAAPTQAQPTPMPTQVPTTPAPTQAPPTPAPTQPQATAAPTQAPPTAVPTQAPPTPAPTQRPTAAPTQAPPAANPALTPAANRLTLAQGATSVTVQGRVAAGNLDRWVVNGSAEQTMSVKQNGSQLVLAIWGADGTVLLSQMAGATSWTGVLPATQDYNIDVIGPSSGTAPYSLTVSFPPAGPTSTPRPPSPPSPGANRINFAPGAISATVSGTVGPGTDRWVVGAGAGQTMIVQLTPAGGQVVLAVSGADGTVLISSAAGATSWSGVLPAAQDYYIEVLAGSAPSTHYALTVTIPPG